jgi:hypothetical protein
MTRLASTWLPAAIVLATTVSLAGACTSHGAGGRCDIRDLPAGSSQNTDCDNGLVCISGAELQLPDGGGTPAGYFCCPIDRKTGIDPSNICYQNANIIGDDAGIPDTGATETGGPEDATTDQSSTEAGPDDAAATDADDASDTGSE